jgi:hypothetical protein
MEAVEAAVEGAGIETGETGEDLLDPVIDEEGELIPLTDEDIEAMEQKPAADPEVTKQ